LSVISKHTPVPPTPILASSLLNYATAGGTIMAMTGIEKLVEKFLTDKTHITVEDCHRLLTGFGYSLRKGAGSHLTFHMQGSHPVTVVAPKGTKYVYLLYVNKVIKELGLEA
jgi:hypothetical protein